MICVRSPRIAGRSTRCSRPRSDPDRPRLGARAAPSSTGRPVHVPDVLPTRNIERPDGEQLGSVSGPCSAMPLLREGARHRRHRHRRAEVAPFTDKQIALLQTFADQAVIAIENARLFEEVQARTRELHGVARAADGDQRRAQRHLPLAHDLQPVLDAIVETAARPLRGDMPSLRARRRPTMCGPTRPPWISDCAAHTDRARRGSLVGRARRRACSAHPASDEPEFRWRTPAGSAFAHRARRAAVARRRRHRRHRAASDRVQPSPTSRSRCSDLRRPGRHRDREHAAVRRGAGAHAGADRSAGAADRDQRGAGASSAARRPSSQPVLDTIVGRARRSSAAESASLSSYEGECLHVRRRARHAAAIDRIRRAPLARDRGVGDRAGRARKRVPFTSRTCCADAEYRRTRCVAGDGHGCGRPRRTRCCVKASPSGSSRSTATRCGRSPTSRSSSCRPSPTRP